MTSARSKASMPPKVLGEGGYGTVTLEDGNAVKHYTKTRHLVQEALVARYLSDSPYIAKPIGVDFTKKTLKLELHSASLQQVLTNGRIGSEPPLTATQQHSIFRCVLAGLADIHGRKLVHADVKTSNILVDKTRTRAVLADYGLSSVSNRAKTCYTTENFSPKDVIRQYRSHDLFGLAITALRLFGGYRGNYSLTVEEARKLVVSYKFDPVLTNCLLRFLADNPRMCMRPEEAYQLLYKKKHSVTRPPDITVIEPCIEISDAIEKVVRRLSTTYNVRRAKRCARATGTLMCHLNITLKKKAEMYAGVMLFVYSTLFTLNPITMDKILHECGITEEQLNAALATIISVREVIDITLAP